MTNDARRPAWAESAFTVSIDEASQRARYYLRLGYPEVRILRNAENAARWAFTVAAFDMPRNMMHSTVIDPPEQDR